MYVIDPNCYYGEIIQDMEISDKYKNRKFQKLFSYKYNFLNNKNTVFFSQV